MDLDSEQIGGKKRPLRLTYEQKEILLAAFAVSNIPTSATLEELSQHTGLTPKWIKSWFSRRRGMLRNSGLVTQNTFSGPSAVELEQRDTGLDAMPTTAEGSGQHSGGLALQAYQEIGLSEVPSFPTPSSEQDRMPATWNHLISGPAYSLSSQMYSVVDTGLQGYPQNITSQTSAAVSSTAYSDKAPSTLPNYYYYGSNTSLPSSGTYSVLMRPTEVFDVQRLSIQHDAAIPSSSLTSSGPSQYPESSIAATPATGLVSTRPLETIHVVSQYPESNSAATHYQATVQEPQYITWQAAPSYTEFRSIPTAHGSDYAAVPSRSFQNSPPFFGVGRNPYQADFDEIFKLPSDIRNELSEYEDYEESSSRSTEKNMELIPQAIGTNPTSTLQSDYLDLSGLSFDHAPLSHLREKLQPYCLDESKHIYDREGVLDCLLDERLPVEEPFKAAMALVLLSKLGLQW